jgi:hypothetical protein
MGTRSVITFKDENNNDIVDIYQQYGGYPDRVGKELKEFLTSHEMVNGFSSRDAKQFNGHQCMVAQFIAQFKKGVGGLYVYAPIKAFTFDDYNMRYGIDYHYIVDKHLNIKWYSYGKEVGVL